jgi:hypothetical protein
MTNMSAYPHPSLPYVPDESCLGCGKPGEFPNTKLVECAMRGCDTKLHARCATQCQACGEHFCSLHVELWDSRNMCGVCITVAEEMEALRSV